MRVVGSDDPEEGTPMQIDTRRLSREIVGLAAVFNSDTDLGAQIDEFAREHNLSRAEALRQILIADPQRKAILERALDEGLERYSQQPWTTRTVSGLKAAYHRGPFRPKWDRLQRDPNAVPAQPPPD